MDPLSAISLAGNIIQFIQFGSQIVSKGRQIYKSSNGLLAENAEMESLGRDIKEITGHIKLSLHTGDISLADESTGSEKYNIETTSRELEDRAENLRLQRAGRKLLCVRQDDQALNAICDGCITIANELSDHVKKLKVNGRKHRQWKSFRQALKTVWGKEEIENVAKRLSVFKGQLELHMLASLRAQHSMSSILEDIRFGALQEGTRDVIKFLLENRSLFETEIRARVKHLEQSSDSQHERTRAAVMETVYKMRDEIIEKERSRSTLLESLLKLKESVRPVDQINHEVHQLLIQALYFDTMIERHEEIDEAYKDTFNWIFRSTQREDRPWANFVDWLRSDNGLYWVNGKVASGKSTLMRHIFNNPETRKHLKEWAQTQNLHIIGFFFWNSGTVEQRSHEGILRSLLYQSLESQPELTQVVLPEEHKRLFLRCTQYKTTRQALTSRSDITWKLTTLQQAFRRLMDGIVHSKLCLFIDGLDEYDGDHAEMGLFFKEVASHSNIKACVSSRPWIVFENAFKGLPCLRLQDLTYDDISQYVDGRLNNNLRWVRLAKNDAVNAQNLKREIITMANGIFLWVKLVITSLLNGLSNHDEISDLTRRLRLLPRGLEKLYAHILGTIEPSFYLEDASKYFQILRKAREAQGQATNEVLEISDTLNLLTLSLADKKYSGAAFDDFILTSEEILATCQRTADRLKTRCAGLLELGGPEQRGYSQQRVIYLHRTARDFLERPDIWPMVLGYTSDSDFRPATSLLQSCVLYLKIELSKTNIMPIAEVWRAIQLAMIYGRMADGQHVDRHEKLLDELDRVVSLQHKQYDFSPFHWSTERSLQGGNPDYMSCDSFISLAIEYGLSSYVQLKVRKDPTIVSRKQGRPLLEYAVCPHRMITNVPNRPKIVKLLLDYGASPNEVYQGSTAWKRALLCLSKRHSQYVIQKEGTSLALSDWLEIVMLLIKHGADPHMSCLSEGRPQREQSASEIIEDCLMESFPVQAGDICLMLVARGDRDNQLKLAPTKPVSTAIQVLESEESTLPPVEEERLPLILHPSVITSTGQPRTVSNKRSGFLELFLCCCRRRKS